MTPPATRRALFAAAVLRNIFSTRSLHIVAKRLADGTLTLPTELESFDLDGGWISVDERLPDSARKMLVYTGWKVSCAYYDDKDAAWFSDGNEEEVTHWRPLPPAPEQTKGK